jgi:hypothetical protein
MIRIIEDYLNVRRDRMIGIIQGYADRAFDVLRCEAANSTAAVELQLGTAITRRSLDATQVKALSVPLSPS